MQILEQEIWFPPQNQADEDGLLAIGGDLTPKRLCHAYANGIFPWFVGEIPLWWCPNPRFVLYPNELHIGKKLKKQLVQDGFSFTHNQCFEGVIAQCAQVKRKGQENTWITDAMQSAFIQLNQSGVAHSFELWQENDLVGGLYGVWAGNIFCGESMFSFLPGASKIAFAKAVEYLKKQEVMLIDCQVHTQYLESMGARFITRAHFLELLKENNAEAIMGATDAISSR